MIQSKYFLNIHKLNSHPPKGEVKEGPCLQPLKIKQDHAGKQSEVASFPRVGSHCVGLDLLFSKQQQHQLFYLPHMLKALA